MTFWCLIYIFNLIAKNQIQILTNSTPITPAPITIIFAGTLSNDRAPVDETTLFSSIYKWKEKTENNDYFTHIFLKEAYIKQSVILI